MSDDISIKNFFSSPDIATKFDISESTLRKYCQILEKSGWQFTKNERQARVFTQQDIDLLETFFQLKDNLSMSLEKSSDMAVSYFLSNDQMIYHESANATNALVDNNQTNLSQEMRHAFAHQQQQFDNIIEKIYDGNDKVIDKINQVLDENDALKKANKELKDALDEILQEQRKPLFKRLFK